MVSIYVGTDVCKERLDVHFAPSGESVSVSYDASGLRELTLRLKALPVVYIALKATGKLETLAAATLAEAGLPVAVGHGEFLIWPKERLKSLPYPQKTSQRLGETS